MKREIYIHIMLPFSLLLLLSGWVSHAQVGINTTTPDGLLDVNPTTMGVVYPNVALTSTLVEAPVVNPNGGPLVAGTVVYNTNTTSTGAVTDVHPGIYVWDGSKWSIHYKKRHSSLYEQTTSLRTDGDYPGDWQDVPGLGVSDNMTFTPKYSGLHKIEVHMNFGGGEIIDNGDVNVAAMAGNFQFTFNSTTETVSVTSYSLYNDHVGGGISVSDVWKETYITLYVNLTAGVAYPFSLEFDQESTNGFVDNGNSGTGRGYIGTDIPCRIEMTYMDE